MVKILEQECVSQYFTFENLTEISFVEFKTGYPSMLHMKNGDILSSSCINCENTPCIISGNQEIVLEELESSQKNTKCPTDAIKMEDQNAININQNTSIKCGLCVQSCPIGAIYIDKDNNLVVNNRRRNLIKTDSPTNFEHPIIELINQYRKVSSFFLN